MRFVIWICTKFTRAEIEEIIKGLTDIVNDRNPEVKPKDDFQEKHPNYRKFYVDPKTPLTPEKKVTEKKYWRDLIKQFKKEYGKKLQPVKNKKKGTAVPKNSRCRICGAPAKYLYFNDGKKRTQLRCKVCNSLSQIHPRNRYKTKYLCPYCCRALYLWKERKDCSIYKCNNDECQCFLQNKTKLNIAEKIIVAVRSSQFKLRYQFREYHFTYAHLKPTEPKRKIINIRNSLNTMTLALAFYVSMGLSSRKTAFILKNIFSIDISYKTVINYAEAAAYHCNKFNNAYKGEVDSRQAGDETYIKINGKNAYVFFFIGEKSRVISAYHVAETRDTLPAIITMNEAIRNVSKDNSETTLITDGNPSYQAGIHFINQLFKKNIVHKKVIGLQNLDNESEEFRPLKQLIERLNRTFKYHTKNRYGFKSKNGAVVLTSLFVTHYNFIRPHQALKYNVPVQVNEITDMKTIQGKWSKIIQMGMDKAA